MTVRRLLQLWRYPFATVFVAAPLGAFFALLAVNALAVVAGLLGMTAIHDILRDVGVNTGPLAFLGGLGAGLSAWAGGGSSGDHEPPAAQRGDPYTTRDKYDPVTKKWTYRWETPSERYSDALSDGIDDFSIGVQHFADIANQAIWGIDPKREQESSGSVGAGKA